MRQKVKLIDPDYRHKLKAKIIENGYRNITDFCKEAKINKVTMAEIICGWRVPGPTACDKIAATLDLHMDQLREILS